MEKSQQTDEVFVKLYDLTKMFTKALQPRYFYQFAGDIDDLASEFFTQFVTPKGRKGAEKLTLLDKYDPEVLPLITLVKVCVIRKLIDFSRQNPVRYLSLEHLVDDNGDCIVKAFNLTSDDDYENTALTDSRFLLKVINGFNKLSSEEKNTYYSAVFDSKSLLANVLQPDILYIHSCPVQQITNKTVVLYVKPAKRLVGFSVEDGRPRGSFQPFKLTEDELEFVHTIGIYNSKFSRELFQEYLEMKDV